MDSMHLATTPLDPLDRINPAARPTHNCQRGRWDALGGNVRVVRSPCHRGTRHLHQPGYAMRGTPLSRDSTSRPAQEEAGWSASQ